MGFFFNFPPNFFLKFPKSTNVPPKFVTLVDRQHLSAKISKSISLSFHRLSLVYVDVVGYILDRVKSSLAPSDKGVQVVTEESVTFLRLTQT